MRAQLKKLSNESRREVTREAREGVVQRTLCRVEFHDNGESFRGRYNHANVKCNNIEERIVDFASQVFTFRE